eukprot:SAG31_NODE_5412_length_2551_cov_1.276509_2_plen_126_part_00
MWWWQLKSDVGLHPPHPVAFMARTSMLGAWQLCGVEPNVTAYRQHLALYKTKQRPILRGGEMYHILPMADGVNWDGFQFFNRELNKVRRHATKHSSIANPAHFLNDVFGTACSPLLPICTTVLTN